MKERFVQSKIIKKTFKGKERAFISKQMRNELKIINSMLVKPNKFTLKTPIAYIVEKEPDFITLGATSLEAGGRFSDNLFLWHTEWLQNIKSLTLKN